MNFPPFPPTMGMMQPPFGVFNKAPLAPPLYVGDLDENVHDELLFDFFSKFGPIHFVRIMKDRATGKSRGFAYINFVYPRDADAARQHAQYEKLGRKHIRIMFKRDVKDLSPEANVFVKNLDPNATVRDLHNHFTQAGSVISAKVATNSEGESLGYGYVQFEKKEDAEAALKALQGTKLKETELQLTSFLSKNKRPDDLSKRNIYIKDLPGTQSEEELKNWVQKSFSRFGEIDTMLVKKHSTDNKYQAFVCYKEEQDAATAFEELSANPLTVEGSDKPIYVNWHQGRSERVRELKRQHQQTRSENNLYVKNLRGDVTEDEVKKAFQQFGNITSVACKDWNHNGQKQGKFGFIAFDNSDDARKAQAEALNVPEIKGLYLADAIPYINLHQSREKRNEFLTSKGRRKMQAGMMGMEGFRNQPFALPNRRFQQFPPPMMNLPFQQPMRGGFKPARGGANRGPNTRFQPRQQFNNTKQPYPQQQHKKSPNSKPVQQTQPQSQAPQQTAITVQTLKNKVGEFLAFDQDKQRQILGELLFPLIKPLAPELAPKITGMLIDLSVLEISEILDFLENPQLLRERVAEARELILESDS